jgi:hypothetical protein
VTAPLRLTNQLPVTGSLLVWEQQQASSQEIVGRQTVQVPSGETVSIHTGEVVVQEAASDPRQEHTCLPDRLRRCAWQWHLLYWLLRS